MKAEFSITNETEYCRSTMAMTIMNATDTYVFTTVVNIPKGDETKCTSFGITKPQAELLVAYLKLTFGL